MNNDKGLLSGSITILLLSLIHISEPARQAESAYAGIS